MPAFNASWAAAGVSLQSCRSIHPRCPTSSTDLDPCQCSDNILGYTSLLHHHFRDLADQRPLHAAPRRCPDSAGGQHLSHCEGLGAVLGDSATGGRVHAVRYGGRCQVARRVDGSYRHDLGACARPGRRGACDCQHGVGNGKLFLAGVEDDVRPHGDGQDDDWRLLSCRGGVRGRLGVQWRGGGPVVVEERVLVLLRLQRGQVGGEEGEVGGHGEQAEGVGERRGEEKDLHYYY